MTRIYNSAVKRTYLALFYKGDRIVKRNSGGHPRRLLETSRGHLENNSYGADRVDILTRSNRRVRQSLQLDKKTGKAVPRLIGHSPTTPKVERMLASCELVLVDGKLHGIALHNEDEQCVFMPLPAGALIASDALEAVVTERLAKAA